MNIMNELATSTIKASKKDSLATKISIFLAVVLLGSIVFVLNSLRVGNYQEILKTSGDHQVEIYDISEDDYDYLKKKESIEKLAFDLILEDSDLEASLYKKSESYWKDGGYPLLSGRDPSREDELIVPPSFLKNNKSLEIGSSVTVNEKNYQIVGEYDDYGFSFEDPILLGFSSKDSKKDLFDGRAQVQVSIWYKHPRDTYTETKELLKDLNIDSSKAEESGKVYFNKEILEYKMIYPNGIFPPKSIIRDAFETYGGLMFLVVLFAVMIYGAFNVWNNRDIKEIALLKSVGMTEKQVAKMVRIKALKLSVRPVLFGTLISYLTANLLTYLMWLNNSITYNKHSEIVRAKMLAPEFTRVPISLATLLLIFILAFITVNLSAMVPAKRSAKINIIEGLNGINSKNLALGKSNITGKIEKSLAKDYYTSYKSTYKVIILTMIISAFVLTGVLVSQAYGKVLDKYDKYQSPYNFISDIYTDSNLNPQLIEELEEMDGIDKIHIATNKAFNISLEDNPSFISDELSALYEEGAKSSEDLFVVVYGLSKADYQTVLADNNIGENIEYLLLNKISDSNTTPYSFRQYIPVAEPLEKELVIRNSEKTGKTSINLGGHINEFPYDLESQVNNAIYIFTTNENLNQIIIESESNQMDPLINNRILISANKNLDEVSAEAEEIISKYYPTSDHSTTSDIKKDAMAEEENRNVTMLIGGIQIILLLLALSNAYNSFHGNLRARRKDFQLLATVGMTDKQIKKMIFLEGRIILRKTLIAYIFVFFAVVTVRSFRSNFEFGFAVKEILLRMDYLPIFLIFIIMATGILLATNSGSRSIQKEALNTILREI